MKWTKEEKGKRADLVRLNQPYYLSITQANKKLTVCSEGGERKKEVNVHT
jgi:hypothetical protein